MKARYRVRKNGSSWQVYDSHTGRPIGSWYMKHAAEHEAAQLNR